MSHQQIVKWKSSQSERDAGRVKWEALAGFGLVVALKIVSKSHEDVIDSQLSFNHYVRMLGKWLILLLMKMISPLCQQPLAAFTLKQSGHHRHHLPIMPLPQSSMMPQALRPAAQVQYLIVCTHRGRAVLLVQPQRMKAHQVCLVQLVKLEAQQCPGSHPAVNSILHVVVPPLDTYP